MKRIAFVIIGMISVGIIISFLVSKEDKPSKPVIVVSIEPLAKLVRMVVPDGYEVKTVVPVGQHLHDFEPALKDRLLIEKSLASFYVGNDLDRWGGDLGMKTALFSSQKGDPHVWIHPLYAKEILLRISDVLKGEGIKVDERQLSQALALCDRMHEELKGLGATTHHDIFVVHDGFSHLAHTYGFSFVSLMKGDEEEPSLERMKKMVEMIREKKGAYILGDHSVGDDVYLTLIRETGVKRGYLSVMESSSLSYEEEMKKNIEGLRLVVGQKGESK